MVDVLFGTKEFMALNLKSSFQMENETILRNGFTILCHSCNTLVIGSGAASLNAAISLQSSGQKDIIIATAKWGAGTSNNAGSDKQTYYKLSIAGNEADSVPAMATDLFNGHCMHGDIALCEAQGSLRGFMNLVRLGVKFPEDNYGAFAGYKTDHDPRSRATSAGPYTSKSMFEALAREIKKAKIKVLDRHQVITLITDGGRTRVTGAIAINLKEKDPLKAFILFRCENIILGTGGPAGIYETSVYPLSQYGSTGMAFRAGATGQNLTESQFGIASVKFRWNLSGSYQQAIPRYVSTEKNGNDKQEFLNDHFPNLKTLARAIFLKGYQWPFDPRKIEDYGSSLIDILVSQEINLKGRRVFLDFTRNPSFGPSDEFSMEKLDTEVFNYLEKSGALKRTPLERLLSINRPAFDLFKEHGIDISCGLLEIAVCVQHNNGGLKGDIWWESDVKHLFPVGEVNGSHGVYRPGGSALNSGQVGSFRAARRIAKHYSDIVNNPGYLPEESEKQLDDTLFLAKKWLNTGSNNKAREAIAGIKNRMSAAGGISRDLKHVSEALSEALFLTETIEETLGASSVKGVAEAFMARDHSVTHLAYLSAIHEYILKGGRSRGSYLVRGEDGKYELCLYDRGIENEILEIKYLDGKVTASLSETRGIPIQDLWFEKVWREYLEDNFKGC
jgi:succinate dehydrogenase/fumarate reductase flavoprotein subunit